MPTTSSKVGRKVKRSFSISLEADAFIRKSSKERKSRSESDTLDALLNELITIRKLQALETAYTDYYDSLNDEEVAEQKTWGAFAESQIAKEDR